MLWLYILLGVLLFIILLLLLPITLKAEYIEDLKCKLIIGFVPITLFPQKPKKPKKEKKEKDKTKKEPKEKKEPEKKKSLLKTKGLDGIIDLIKRAADLVSGILKDFFGSLVIKRFELSITVAGDDAADTAIKYGYCCAGVYPAVGTILRIVKCKKYGVDIAPDFAENAKTKINLDLVARIRVFHIMKLLFKQGPKAIKLLLSIKE